MTDCVGIPQQFALPKAFQTIRDLRVMKIFKENEGVDL
jgi:hypothetical protein